MLKKFPIISTNNSLEYNFLTFFVLKAVNGYFILSASVIVGQAIFILIYQIGQGSPFGFYYYYYYYYYHYFKNLFDGCGELL